MADVLKESKNYQKHCKPKYHATKSPHFTHCVYKTYRKPYCFPGEAFHFSPTSRKTNVIPGSRIEGRKNLVINQGQFIRAVADNMKERLFTTASKRAQPSVHATRKENYITLVGQMDVLDPEKN